MRLPFRDGLPFRVHVAVIAALAVVAAPTIGSGQAAQRPTDQNPIGTLNLRPGEVDAEPSVRPQAVPRGYALVIGVGNYPNLRDDQQLPFAGSDAREMYRVLISQEGGAFPAENVRVLTDEQASLANIRQELEEWLPSVAQPEDRVVVYFVGHGFVEGGQGYLAPWDVDPDRLGETGYSMTDLGDVMANRVQARWRALFTEACHSGKVNAETTNEGLDEQLNSLPGDFLNFSAAREQEEAHYDARLATGFGFFTYFLTRALLGEADYPPCDGLVTADELVHYVRDNVWQYARARGRFQTPSDRGSFDPRMGLGISRLCLDDTGRRKLGAALVEVNLAGVDLYVNDEFRGTLSEGDPPFLVPGLQGGEEYEFKGVRRGYEPETRLILIPPGQEIGVRLNINYAQRRIRPEARRLNEQGERLLFSRRSTTNLVDIYGGRSQGYPDLRRARDLFAKALEMEPAYAKAASNLGEARQLLYEYDESLDAYGMALEIDPSNADTRVGYAGVLLESGDPDAAIRELTEAERLQEPTTEIYAMRARAFWDKRAWRQAAAEARRAIELDASNAQAHVWKADALRNVATDEEPSPVARRSLYRESGEDYRRFLRLTNFESSLLAKVGFYFIGFGVGSRSHADRELVAREYLRIGNLGLCLTERGLGNLLKARRYCEIAAGHGEEHPITHFVFGNVNLLLVEPERDAGRRCDYLEAAASSYRRMLELNPYLQESDDARANLQTVARVAPRLGCSGV